MIRIAHGAIGPDGSDRGAVVPSVNETRLVRSDRSAPRELTGRKPSAMLWHHPLSGSHLAHPIAGHSWSVLIAEGALFLTGPEIRQNDNAGNRRICTPYRGKGKPLNRHHNQQDRQVGGAENHHHPDLREKKRATRDNDIEQGDDCIVGRLIHIYKAVSFNGELKRKCGQRP